MTSSSEADAGPVIRTVSLNPAVDVSLSVRRLEPIHKLRAFGATREAGGGGVNVARVLARLHMPVECVVAAGGATGSEVTAALTDADVPWHALDVDGATRESVQIVDRESGHRYRIVLEGPPLRSDAIDALASFDNPAPPSVIVLSGSLPVGSDDATYARLAEAATDSFTIVDTSGEALAAAARAPVDLLKPSLSELEALVGHSIDDAPTLREAIESTMDRFAGVGALLVSLGEMGAVLADRSDPIVLVKTPPVPAVSAVGAGDAMVAGVAAAIHANAGLLHATKLGAACGAATVTTPGSELCQPPTVAKLLDGVRLYALRDDHPIRPTAH